MQDRVNDPATRRRVLDALHAVLSDNHNYELGLATLRDLMDHTVQQDGATALSDLTVALSLELAEALDRIAHDEPGDSGRRRDLVRRLSPRWVAHPIRDAPGRGVPATAWMISGPIASG